jgi:hypothetical protein
MKKITKLLVLSILAIYISSCSTGNIAYQHGDYYKACSEAIERLRANPKSTKSQTVLMNSYPLAQKTAMREIDNANLANDDDRFDRLVYQYERLNQLADAIFACPKALELIPNPSEYVTELSNSKKMAAQNAYNRGQNALNAGTLEQARLAYNYFSQANKYVLGYNDVINKINESRYFATLRVIVQKPYTNANFQYSADFFYNNLLTQIRQNEASRFIRFYTPDEANKENMKNPHQYIVLNFEDFSVGNIRETSNTIDLKRDSVIVGTVKVDGKTYNSYNTVTAKLTTLRREITSGGVLSLRVIDVQTNQELQRNNFSGSYVWNTTWANFKGDDRALTDDQKKMCNRDPQTPPTPQDMFIEFTKPIYNQTVGYIRSLYSKY